MSELKQKKVDLIEVSSVLFKRVYVDKESVKDVASDIGMALSYVSERVDYGSKIQDSKLIYDLYKEGVKDATLLISLVKIMLIDKSVLELVIENGKKNNCLNRKFVTNALKELRIKTNGNKRGRKKTNLLPRNEQTKINQRNALKRKKDKGLVRLEVTIPESLKLSLTEEAEAKNMDRNQYILEKLYACNRGLMPNYID